MSLNFLDSAYQSEQQVEAETVAYQEAAYPVTSRIYQTVLTWTLRVGVFLLPLFFLPWTTGILELNKQFALMVVAAVGLIAWLLNLVSTGHLSWRGSALHKGVLAIWAAGVIATVFSISRFTSLFGSANNLTSSLVTITGATILYFLITQSGEEEGLMIRRTLDLSLVVALVYGVLQILGLYVVRLPFAVSSAFNTVGSPDALGVMAAIALPLLSSTSGPRWMRYVRGLGFAAGLAILVMLNWWVLWTIAIAGMVGLIAFGSLLSDASPRFALSRFILPMTVIVVGVFLSVVHLNINAIKNKLPVEVAPSYSLSTQVTKSVLQDGLITGYGPGMFSTAFDRYGAGQLSNSTLSNAKFYLPNAELLNVASEAGLIGIVALIVLFLCGIQALIYALRNKSKLLPSTPALFSALLAIAVTLFVYPFTLTMLIVGYTLLALASLAVWGHNTRAVRVEDSPSLSMASSLGFVAGLILVLVGVYFGFSVYFADVKYAQALGQADISKAANDLVSAVNWNGQNDAYYRGASQAALGLLSQELNKKADPADTQRSTRIQNYMASAINLAKQATTLAPREALNWDNLGMVYQNLLGLVDGTDKLSESAYLKAADLRPGDATYFNKIGSMYLSEASLDQQLAQGNQNSQQLIANGRAALASAETNFQKAVNLSNNYGLAIYNLGVVYDAEGKLPEAIKQLEKVAPFNSDQPDLLFELGLLYYRNNQMDQAFSTLQQVLVLQPNYANAHWYLSQIYEQRKDIPNAIDQLQKILSVDANKDNQTVIDKLHQLQTGQTPAPAAKGINQKPL